MKNVDIKKLFVFILIIVILILIALGLGKLVGKGSTPSEEVRKEVENLTTNYFTTMTYGYMTEFDGVDVLYREDKTTYKDLNAAAVVNLAIQYAQDNKIDLSVNEFELKKIESTYKEKAPAYRATGVKQAVKELFGEDLEYINAEGFLEYKYNFIYDPDTDTFVQFENSYYDKNIRDESINVKTKIVETTKKGDKILVTLIVAYVLTSEDNTYYYYSEASGSDASLVGDTTSKDFLKDKDDEFTHYTMTLKKNSNGYQFESIEKNKK